MEFLQLGNTVEYHGEKSLIRHSQILCMNLRLANVLELEAEPATVVYWHDTPLSIIPTLPNSPLADICRLAERQNWTAERIVSELNRALSLIDGLAEILANIRSAAEAE